MSKAVFVMDMPEDCGDCHCIKFVNGRFMCHLKDKICGDARKPDWCPLRPIPDKKPTYLVINNEHGYCEGWNACIDAIGGGDGD